eukprot:gene12912-biopygen3502
MVPVNSFPFIFIYRNTRNEIFYPDTLHWQSTYPLEEGASKVLEWKNRLNKCKTDNEGEDTTMMIDNEYTS